MDSNRGEWIRRSSGGGLGNLVNLHFLGDTTMNYNYVWIITLDCRLYGIYGTHYAALKSAQLLWEADPSRKCGSIKVTRERVELETDSLEMILLDTKEGWVG